MARTDSSSQSSIAPVADPVRRDSPGNKTMSCAVAVAAFKAEVAALEGLDERTFADVLPHTRAPIVARVAARGRLDP